MSPSREPGRSPLLPGALWVTVFITGAEILAVEIVGARLITPQFGVSLYVWSSLIAVTLIALAVGYALGGWLADRRGARGDLGLLLLIAALALGAVPASAGPVFALVADAGLRLGSLLSAGLLFMPSLIALAMITPYAVRLLVARSFAYGDGRGVGATEDGVLVRHGPPQIMTRGDLPAGRQGGASPPDYNIGRIVGSVYALSTAGSVFGALAAGFWLVPSLPLPRIFLVLACGLVGAAALLWTIDRHRPAAVLLAVTLAALAGAAWLREPSSPSERFRTLFTGQSLYGEWRVLEADDTRLLLLNGIIQGGVDSTGSSVFPYSYLMERLLDGWRPAPRRVLLIGLGGGIMARSLARPGGPAPDRPPIEVDVAELDPMAVELARRYFGYQPPTGMMDAPGKAVGPLPSSQRECGGEAQGRGGIGGRGIESAQAPTSDTATRAPAMDSGRLLIEDGRRAINRLDRRYDAVILDAYAAETLPYHLLSLEAFEAVRRHLEPGGVLLVNDREPAGPGSSPGLRALSRTLREVFPIVEVYEAETGGELDSRFVVATVGSGESTASGAPTEKPETVTVTLETGPFRDRPMTARRRPIDDRDGLLLTDAYNPMEWLDAPVAEAMREATRRYLR